MSAESETPPDPAGETTSHHTAPRLGLTALACATRVAELAARLDRGGTADASFVNGLRRAAGVCAELAPEVESQPVGNLVAAFCAGDTGSLFLILDWLQDRAAAGDRERGVQLSKVLAAVGRARSELKFATRPRSAKYCFGRLERRLEEVFWQDMVHWPEAMSELAAARRLADRSARTRRPPVVTPAGEFVPGADEPGDEDGADGDDGADDLYEDTDDEGDDAAATEAPAGGGAVEVDFDSGSFLSLQQAVTENFGRAVAADMDRRMEELTANIAGGDGSPAPASLLRIDLGGVTTTVTVTGAGVTREQRVSALAGSGPQWQLTARSGPGEPDRFPQSVPPRAPAGRVWLFVESEDRALCHGWHVPGHVLAAAMTREGGWGAVAPLGELYTVTGEGRLLPV